MCIRDSHISLFSCFSGDQVNHSCKACRESLPVSYTHLDVYKRQLLDSSLVGGTTVGTGKNELPKVFESVSEDKDGVITVTPVSYTHLDVYKRQMYWNVREMTRLMITGLRKARCKEQTVLLPRCHPYRCV